MYGVEISSLSSRIAKCCEAAIGFCSPPLSGALSSPRWAISRVVSANASRPLSVNSIVTIGGPPGPFSKFCSGFLMSEPLRTGLSWITHQLSTSPRCWSVGRRSSSRRTMMPSGTSMISALKVSYEDPDYIAGTVFDRLVYGFHPYGKPESGTPASLASLTRDDLIAFHKRWFAPNNAILAVVGDVTAEQAFAGVEKAFGSWPKAELTSIPGGDVPPPTRRVIVVDRPGAVQTDIRVGNI